MTIGTVFCRLWVSGVLSLPGKFDSDVSLGSGRFVYDFILYCLVVFYNLVRPLRQMAAAAKKLLGTGIFRCACQ